MIEGRSLLAHATKMKKLLLLFMAFHLSGCVLLMKEPKAKLKDIEVSGLSLKEINLDLNLEVENPNKKDLTVDKMSYLIQVKNENVTEGFIQGPWTLKGSETTKVTLPVKFPVSGLLNGIGNLINGENEVILSGHIWGEGFKIPYKSKEKIRQ